MRRLVLPTLLTLVMASGAWAIDPVINEFVANHTGTDTNEYFEVYGDPNTDLSAYTIVEIEGEGTGKGLIDDATFTVGMTDASGYWWTGYQNNVLENGTVTYLLVTGYTGSVGQDIDTDDDGVIDVTFWTAIIDSVGVFDGGAGELVYSSVVLDGSMPPPDNTFAPGGASRIPNGIDTDTVGDWLRNDFDLAGIPGFPGTYEWGEALNTPLAMNDIPEPATLVLLGLGGLALLRRR
jgi:hypothetical protein